MRLRRSVPSNLIFTLLICCVVLSQDYKAFAVTSAPAQASKAADAKANSLLVPDPSINDLSPALRRASIITKQLLEANHFSRHPVTKQMAKDWVRDYMNALDYRHVFFFQSDLDQVAKQFSDDMPDLTAQGDVSPAFSIFSLFKKRFTDRMRWVEKRLKEPFDFAGNDFYQFDRSNDPWPKSQAEADQLWEARLKFDVLQKKLELLDKDKVAADKVKNPAPSPTPRKDEKQAPAADEKQKNTATAKPEDKAKEDPIASVAKHYKTLEKNLQEYDSETILQTYLSTLAGLYDPHSMFLSPSALEDFSISTQLSLQGIGAVLSSEDGYCTIKEIVPGGPADLDKRLKVNDRIVAVGQGEESYVDIIDVKLRNAVKLIRGPKGTKVRLKIIPGTDSTKTDEIILTRDKIEFTAQQASAQLFDIPNGTQSPIRIGVIRLPSFYGNMGDEQGDSLHSTTDDVAMLLNYLKSQDINGLILDLRGNGGGLLDEAINLTSLFIDKGPVVQVKDYNEKVSVRSDGISSKIYNGPMIVLTDRSSASASEIFAGALQNYSRAIIVGDKSTHGKGTVQAVAPLGKYFSMLDSGNVNAGGLKLTIQKFYLPNGHSTQNRGVIPDISLPSPNDFLKIGEADLPHALPWDEIPPAPGFKPFSAIPITTIDKLRARSKQRVTLNPLYSLLQEEIAKIQKNVKEGKVSLNEAQRSKERLAEDVRQKKAKELEQLFAKSAPVSKKYVIRQGNQKRPRVEEDKTETKAASSKAAKKGAVRGMPGEEDDDGPITVDLRLHETMAILLDWLAPNAEKSKGSASQDPAVDNLVPEINALATSP